MSRIISLAAGIYLAMPILQAAAEPDVTLLAPVGHENAATYFTHGSAHNSALVAGYNDVDKPRQVFCNNASGCTIAITAMVVTHISQGFLAICSFADGIAAKPSCSTGQSDIGFSLQVIKVGAGTHSVQTRVNIVPDVKVLGTLKNWVVQYTVYNNNP